MTEEEQKAIEYFKNIKNWWYNSLDRIYKLNSNDKEQFDILLNLIEKQQKEIEILKKKRYILNAETGEVKEIPISDNYISKDKIKEFIKEVENREENYTFDKLTSEDIRRTIITNLEELLESEE